MEIQCTNFQEKNSFPSQRQPSKSSIAWYIFFLCGSSVHRVYVRKDLSGVSWHFESRTRSTLDLCKLVKLISDGIHPHRNTKNTKYWRVTLRLIRKSHSDLQRPANVKSLFSREEHQEQSLKKSSDPWLITLLLSEKWQTNSANDLGIERELQ